MESARERQRLFNLVFVNAIVVLAWYFERTKFRDGHMWLVTLPIILATVNGIVFAGTVSRSASVVQSGGKYRVFRFPWRTRAAIFSAIGLFLSWTFLRRYHDPFIATFPLIIVVNGFAECRRKIVVSENEIAYRPPIGSTQRIVLSDAKSIELGQVLVGRRFWPAAKFMLSDGLTVSIPLGATGYQQVFDAIVNRWKSNRGDHSKSGKSSTDIASDLH